MNDDNDYQYIELPGYMLEPYKPLGPRPYWQLLWGGLHAEVSCAFVPWLALIPESGFRQESRGRYFSEFWA